MFFLQLSHRFIKTSTLARYHQVPCGLCSLTIQRRMSPRSLPAQPEPVNDNETVGFRVYCRSSVLSGTTAAMWSPLSIDANGSPVPIRGDTWIWVEPAAALYGALGAKFVTTSGSETHLGSASTAFGLLIQTSVGSAGGRGSPVTKRSGWAA